MVPTYRFLAVDVDGTLLDSRNELPDANRRALHEAHEAGIKVCLCTGRCLAETRRVIERIGLDLDAGVFAFGAIVSRLPAGDTLHRRVIGEPLATRLVSHFQSRGCPVLALYDATESGFDYRFLPGERNVEAYERWMAMSPSRIERIEAWRAGPVHPVRIGIIDDPDHIQSAIDSLRREFPADQLKCNPIYAPNYRLHVVECFAPEVNKWHGIVQLTRMLGIERSQIAAIGDDVNDLEMIREAGLGIAMGNAIEAVKAAARWQAPANDAAGVAAAIEALLAGKL